MIKMHAYGIIDDLNRINTSSVTDNMNLAVLLNIH